MKHLFTLLVVICLIFSHASTEAQIKVLEGTSEITYPLSFCSSPTKTLSVRVEESKGTGGAWINKFQDGDNSITLKLNNGFTFGNAVTFSNSGNINTVNVSYTSTSAQEISLTFKHSGEIVDFIKFENIIINAPPGTGDVTANFTVENSCLYNAEGETPHKEIYLTSTAPELSIGGTYAYNTSGMSVPLTISGTGACPPYQYQIEEGDWTNLNNDNNVILKLGQSVRVKNGAGRISEYVHFTDTYLQKPGLSMNAGSSVCWNDEVTITASYDYNSDEVPDSYQLIYIDESGNEFEVKDLKGMGDFSYLPTGGGQIYSKATYSDDDVVITSDTITLPTYIAKPETFTMVDSKTYAYDHGTIDLLNHFSEGSSKPELDNGTVDVTLNNTDYKAYRNGDMFYKFMIPTFDNTETNAHTLESDTKDLLYGYNAPNGVRFYYGVVKEGKVCYDSIHTNVVVLRDKILLPQASFCSNDNEQQKIIIDNELGNYLDANLREGYYQHAEFDKLTFVSNGEEVSGVEMDSTKITFTPSEIYTNEDDQPQLFDITAYAKIITYQNGSTGTGFYPGWRPQTSYRVNDTVQYNGNVYKPTQSIPVEIQIHPIEDPIFDPRLEDPIGRMSENTGLTPSDDLHQITGEPLASKIYPAPSKSSIYWRYIKEYKPSTEDTEIGSLSLKHAEASFYIYAAKTDASFTVDDVYCRTDKEVEIAEEKNYTITSITSTDNKLKPDNADKKWTFRPSNLLGENDSIEITWQVNYVDNHGCTPDPALLKFKVNEHYGFIPELTRLGLDTVYCPKKAEISLKKTSGIKEYTSVAPVGGPEVDKFKPSGYFKGYKEDSVVRLSFQYTDILRCIYKDTMTVRVSPDYQVDKNAVFMCEDAGKKQELKHDFCPAEYDYALSVGDKYVIDSIHGEGVSSEDKEGNIYYTFNPFEGTNGSGLTMYYTDKFSKCPYFVDHKVNISADNVDSSNEIISLKEKYCITNAEFEIERKNGHRIDTLTGYGVFNKDNTYKYSPLRAADSLGSNFDIYSGSVWNDTVRVTFLDAYNCPYEKKKVIRLNGSLADKSGGLVNLDAGYCKQGDSIQLLSSYTIDSIKAMGVDSVNQKWYLYPEADDFMKILDDQDVPVKYYYQDVNGCRWSKDYTFTMYAVPQTKYVLDTTTLCYNDTTRFIDVTTFAEHGRSYLKQWEWNFGDGDKLTGAGGDLPENEEVHNGRTLGTYKQPGHIYREHGVYPVWLKLVTDKGCAQTYHDTIVVGNYPQLAFDFSGHVHNRTSLFVNKTSTPEYDTVGQYIWDFNDPQNKESIREDLSDSLYYTFAETGVHNIKLTAISNNRCMSDTVVKFPVFPYVKVTDRGNYLATFDAGAEGWLPGHSYRDNLVSGWKQSTLQGPLGCYPNTGGAAWLTGVPADNIIDEQSWVESPAFDFRELAFPLLSVDIFQSLETGRDGAVVQYTLDDGLHWQLLSNGTMLQGGLHWYNQMGIISNPGQQSGTGNMGWSLDNKQWQTARFPLDQVRQKAIEAGAETVRFRIAYASDAGNMSDGNLLGFAFDNFAISARNRIVMMEQFVNSSSDRGIQQQEEQWLDEFVKANPREVVDIRYHNYISHDYDPLFYINPPDISARSMEYGATVNQLTMVDGVHRCVANAEEEAKGHYNIRTLTDKRFDIEVETSTDDQALTITANITKLVDTLAIHGSDKCVVRMAIVQHAYKHENEEFKNVLVELLPNGEGNVVGTIPASLAKGQTLTFTGTWKPNVTTIGNTFKLVVYVQGIWGVDEIHQAWFKEVVEVPQVSIARPVEMAVTEQSRFSIYPSPVKERLHIKWEEELASNVEWKLISSLGVTVRQGVTPAGVVLEKIDTRDLAAGVYLLVTRNPHSNITEKRKILVVD